MTGKTVSGRRLNAFGAASCTNAPLFSALKMPAAFTIGTPVSVSALSINCASAVGPVTATPSAGAAFTLLDDGAGADLAAGDGIFSATWTPLQAFAFIDFSSPAGTERVSMPDLTITAVSGPASANRGDTITLNSTVSNPSSMAAPASSLNLYVSVDGVIASTGTSADTLLGSVATPALAAGTQQAVAANVTIPTTLTPATYFLGAIVDPDKLIDEADELNNAKAGNTIVVGNLAVDLSLTALSGPATAFTGDAVASRPRWSTWAPPLPRRRR